MFRTFYQKILSLLFIFLLITSLSLSFFYLYRSYRAAQRNIKESGFLLTETLGYSCEFSIYSQDPTFLLPTVEGIFQSEQTLFLGVYTNKGALIHGQDKTSEGFIYKIPDFAIRRVLKGENVMIEGKTSEKADFYDFFVPVKANIMTSGDEEEVIGMARIGISLEKIKKDSLSLIFLGVGINLIAAGMLFFLSRFLAGTVTKPINALSRGAKEFGEGNLDYRIVIKGSDEIDELAKAFNGMAENLSKSQRALEETNTILEIKVLAKTKELKDTNQSLEKEVEKRTKELRSRIEELEKFHKLTVGRELRMADLKKEVRELEEENKKIKRKKEK